MAIVTGINDIAGGDAMSPTRQKGSSLLFTQVWVLRDGK
jgi:hypothetical protein